MKALSLTNLDRITELDFNRTSNVGAVGGLLSISKLQNLKILKAENNKLDNVFFSAGNNTDVEELHLSNNLIRSLTNFQTFTRLKYVDFSENSLSLSDVDTVLTTLDSSGITDGTVKLEGTNALPTFGKHNTAKLSLENKNWSVTVNGGIDARFTAAQGYEADSSTTNTSDHPDWEGGSGLTHWKNDLPNSVMTCSSSFKSIRSTDIIEARVGDTINVSVTYDYGTNILTTDTDPNPNINQRSFAVSLIDIGAFPQSSENITNHDHVSFMAKFLPFSYQNSTAYVKLFQGNPTTGEPDFQIGNSTAIPLAAVNDGTTGDTFTLEFSITVGADAASTIVTASLTNDTDGFSVSGNGSLNTTGLAGFYSSLVSSTSKIKVNMQTGKLADLNIGEINVHSVTARVI